MIKLFRKMSRLTFAVLSILFVVTSCTLSMEDWIEKDEDKGYNKLEKVEYDGLSYEYQFKDETRSLTSDILEYLAYTDGDTVLHFMDNLPEEYRPRVGGYVVAFCCDELPMGLNARVESITHSDGMFHVAIKAVDLEETYKEFNYHLDVQMRFTQEDDSVARKAHRRRAMRPSSRVSSDGTYWAEPDWATYDYIVSGGKQSTRGTNSTDANGGNNFDFTEDDHKTNKDPEKKDEPLMKIEISISELYKDMTGSDLSWAKLLPDIKVELALLEKVRLEKDINVAKKYERTKTTSSRGVRLSFSLGSGIDILSFIKDHPKVKNAIEDVIKKGGKKGKFVDKFKDGAAVFPFALGPVPCVFKVTPTFDLKISVIGNLDMEMWGPETVQETITKNGEKSKDTKPEKTGKKEPNQISFNAVGEVSLTGGVEAFVGVGTYTPPSGVLGIGGYAEVKAEAKFSFGANLAGDDELANSKDGLSFTFSIDVGAKAIAGSWFNHTFAHHDFKLYTAKAWQYYPTVSFDEARVYHNIDEYGRRYREMKLAYKFTDLGHHMSSWYKKYVPYLYVEDKGSSAFFPVDGKVPDKLEENKSYEFTYDSYAGDHNVTVYPILLPKDQNAKIKSVSFHDHTQKIPNYMRPDVEYLLEKKGDTYKHLYQSEGRLNMIVTGSELIYNFMMAFNIKNVGCIEDYWDDWGVFYSGNAEYPDGHVETIPGKYLSLNKSIRKSGKYKIEHKFKVFFRGKRPTCEIQAILYFVPKGTNLKVFLEGIDGAPYMANPVSYDKRDGFKLLNRYLKLVNEAGYLERPKWYNDKSYTHQMAQ